MKTKFPVKKTFYQDFLNKKWDIVFTLKYEQATIQEYYDYLSKNSEDQAKELYEIFSPASCLALFITNDIKIAGLVNWNNKLS